jgi:hypothetical protein
MIAAKTQLISILILRAHSAGRLDALLLFAVCIRNALKGYKIKAELVYKGQRAARACPRLLRA